MIRSTISVRFRCAISPDCSFFYFAGFVFCVCVCVQGANDGGKREEAAWRKPTSYAHTAPTSSIIIISIPFLVFLLFFHLLGLYAHRAVCCIHSDNTIRNMLTILFASEQIVFYILYLFLRATNVEMREQRLRGGCRQAVSCVLRFAVGWSFPEVFREAERWQNVTLAQHQRAQPTNPHLILLYLTFYCWCSLALMYFVEETILMATF